MPDQSRDSSSDQGPTGRDRGGGHLARTRGSPSLTRSIAHVIVIKDEDLFFVAERDGRVPLEEKHGLGLYYHDCRYLNGYDLQLADAEPLAVAASAALGFEAQFELTNLAIEMQDGGAISKAGLGVRWTRLIDHGGLALHDRIRFQNNTQERAELPVALRFRAEFEDVFEVRSTRRRGLGRLHPPTWDGDALRFRYDGADGLRRGLSAPFAPGPRERDGTSARFRVDLPPRESREIVVSLVLSESREPGEAEARAHRPPVFGAIEAALHRSAEEWLGRHTEIRSDNRLLDAVLDRSIRDLRLLRTRLDGREFFAGGIPWYVALIGRDCLIASLLMLAYRPEMAAETLRLVARYQGRRTDHARDEEPGRILHELRVGELAHTGKIPQAPYYGAIDTTPLFLILLARHAAWTGDLSLFRELRHPVEDALVWIDRFGDRDGDLYIEYQSRAEDGIANQGWKDSAEGIVHHDGRRAEPPIALVEVQGYAYLAKVLIADLCERAGESEQADRLRRDAEQLRERFNRDFWLEDRGFYAMALDKDKRPVDALGSNPGQALWSGIAKPDQARRVIDRVMAEDFFSGWGVRSLAASEPAYNPVGYHLGTVWPHDNALIAAGCRRYGGDEAARRICRGLVEASQYFDHYRLPEVFAGFARGDYPETARYPDACHPQAWSAAALPSLVANLLGLEPEAFERRLRIVRPILPEFCEFLEVRRLRVGAATADLRFERAEGGAARVQVLRVDGPLDVVVEESIPGAPSSGDQPQREGAMGPAIR